MLFCSSMDELALETTETDNGACNFNEQNDDEDEKGD